MTPYEPTFISDWITAKAQDDNKVEFFVLFPSDLQRNEPPVKVIVEVKVTDGGDSYIFNAFGSAPRDDDVNEKYGGVIYFYNATGVLILLPEKYENDPDDLKTSNGKAVYLGKLDLKARVVSLSSQSHFKFYLVLPEKESCVIFHHE